MTSTTPSDSEKLEPVACTGQDYLNTIKAHRVAHGSSFAVARDAVDGGWRPITGSGHRHTAILDAIRSDVLRQHPDAFCEDSDSEIVIPSGTEAFRTWVKIDLSALAEAALCDHPQPHARAPDSDRQQGGVESAHAVAEAERDHWLKEATKHKRPGRRSDHEQSDVERARIAQRIADKIAALTTQPVPVDASAAKGEEDECYEIGKRDGYESAIQDLDLATGGDGEFRWSNDPDRCADVPIMKARIIERFAALQPTPAPDSGSLSPASGWRDDMENAPRDVRVLVYRPSPFDDDRIFHAALSSEDGWWMVHDGKFDHALRGNDPTHWQPLPLPPANSKEPG